MKDKLKEGIYIATALGVFCVGMFSIIVILSLVNLLKLSFS